jgi:pimeloyl-ACP methyl ester carboxylesterase
MATPTLSKHTIPGTLGEILIDVRAGGRGSARPAILLLHGFKGFKDWGMFPRLAERIAQAGFSAVSPNLSGSGVDQTGDFSLPERFGHNTFSAELDDVRRVIEALFAGRIGVPAPSSFGIVGHSRGGGIAILHTAQDARVKSLVTWAAISHVQRWSAAERASWRASGRTDVVNARTGQVLPLYLDVLDDIEHNTAELDIEAAARRIAVPWLIIHGAEDESVSFTEAERLKAASSRPETRLLPIEDAGHTFGAVHPWRSSTPQLDSVFDATLAWLSTHLC